MADSLKDLSDAPLSQDRRRGRPRKSDKVAPRSMSMPRLEPVINGKPVADHDEVVDEVTDTKIEGEEEEGARGAKRLRHESDSCLLCTDQLVDDNNIQCNCCLEKVCKQCSKIPDEFWKLMRKNMIPGTSWLCNICQRSGGLPSLRRINDTLESIKSSNEIHMNKLDGHIVSLKDEITLSVETKINEKMKSLTHSIEKQMSKKFKEDKDSIIKVIDSKIDNKLANMEHRLDSLGTDTIKKLEEQMDKRISETIEKKMETVTSTYVPASGSPGSPNTKMNNTITNVSAEMEEKKKRKNNVIIHGLYEPIAENRDEQVLKDRDLVSNIVNGTLGVTLEKVHFSGLIRLGKIENKGKRPLLVTLPTNEIKEEIYSRLPRLKHSKFSDISIKHDMTPLERQAHNKLVEKAKAMEQQDNSGNFEYRVRGPPWKKYIAKLKKREEPRERNESAMQEETGGRKGETK